MFKFPIRKLIGLTAVFILTLGIVGILAPQLQFVRALDCSVPSTYMSIQDAIDDTDCDTILVSSGTYMENLEIGRSVAIQGSGASKPIINGGDNGRVVTISGSGVRVYMTYLRITNGDATSDSTSARNGGGILVTNDARLDATYLDIDNNIASTAANTGFGGGIAIFSGSAYITDTLVTSNYANLRGAGLNGGGQGGGLYINGDSYLSLYSSEIYTNVASANANTLAAGGGLFQNGDSTVYSSNNTWRGNIAKGEDSGTCAGCSLTSGSGDGGAIAVQVATTEAQLYVNYDSFYENIANASNDDFGNNEKSGGGAISLMSTNTAGSITGTVSSSYFYGNIAKAGTGATPGSGDGRGGAIHVRLATLTVEKSTLLDNVAAVSANGSGGGIYIREPEEDDYLHVTNSVIAGNTRSGAGEGAQLYINYSSASGNDAIIRHTTLADDVLNNADALFYHGPSANDYMEVTNSIIANHDVGIQNVNATGMARARYILFYNNNDNHPSPGAVAFPGDDESTWIVGDPNPLFVDPAGGDYHIQSTSPAIDAGQDDGIMMDIDGEMRPQGMGFDVGADEYVSVVYLPYVVK